MINPSHNPAPRYRLSAVEWVLRVAGREGLTPPLRDFAIALDKHTAFAALAHADAHYVTAAIVADLLHHDKPGHALQQRLRALLSGEDGVAWEDPHAVYQTLVIAAQLATITDD